MESILDKAVLLNTSNLFPTLPYLDLNSTYPEDLLCTKDDVRDLDQISDLDCNKSSGPDDILAKMLKETATSKCFISGYLICHYPLDISLMHAGWSLYPSLTTPHCLLTIDQFPFIYRQQAP